MSDAILDEDRVGSLSLADRSALAYTTAAQVLANALPSWESVPLLSEAEFEELVGRVRGIADDLLEAGGQRGIDLWKIVQ